MYRHIKSEQTFNSTNCIIYSIHMNMTIFLPFTVEVLMKQKTVWMCWSIGIMIHHYIQNKFFDACTYRHFIQKFNIKCVATLSHIWGLFIRYMYWLTLFIHINKGYLIVLQRKKEKIQWNCHCLWTNLTAKWPWADNLTSSSTVITHIFTSEHK